MTSADRLADIADALDEADIPFLVMGGHAVRFYGLERQTVDFDFHLSTAAGSTLAERLRQTRLFRTGPLREEPSWRQRDFKRFQIGVLQSGKEEWVEFWFRNHLLAPFDELFARREQGRVARRDIGFLALPDLIRSKETERDEDWRDVSVLEEFLDERHLRDIADDRNKTLALSALRSRRGFERALLDRQLADRDVVDAALAVAVHPVTAAWLFPYASPEARSAARRTLEPSLGDALGHVTPASGRHLALVEATRIAYQRAAKTRDREDKERILREQ